MEWIKNFQAVLDMKPFRSIQCRLEQLYRYLFSLNPPAAGCVLRGFGFVGLADAW